LSAATGQPRSNGSRPRVPLAPATCSLVKARQGAEHARPTHARGRRNTDRPTDRRPRGWAQGTKRTRRPKQTDRGSCGPNTPPRRPPSVSRKTSASTRPCGSHARWERAHSTSTCPCGSHAGGSVPTTKLSSCCDFTPQPSTMTLCKRNASSRLCYHFKSGKF
jgi:hypothetical protein